MKNKFKSYSFWMSVSAAIVLVLNNLGKVFGFAVDGDIVTKIVDSVCGVLILFGVIEMTKDDSNKDNSNKDEKKSDDKTLDSDEKSQNDNDKMEK